MNQHFPSLFFLFVKHFSTRRFFINKVYINCPKDIGWLVVVDASPFCSWEYSSIYPVILYSTTTSEVNWNDAVNGKEQNIKHLSHVFSDILLLNYLKILV